MLERMIAEQYCLHKQFSKDQFSTVHSKQKEIIKWLGSLCCCIHCYVQDRAVNVCRIIKSFLLCFLLLSLIIWHRTRHHWGLVIYYRTRQHRLLLFYLFVQFSPCARKLWWIYCTLLKDSRIKLWSCGLNYLTITSIVCVPD